MPSTPDAADSMPNHDQPAPPAVKPRSLHRREFLRVGLSGFATLSLPALLQAMDQFEAQALSLLTSPAARAAFDLSQESEAVRDRA